jgi:hypothetical protein
LGKQVRNTKAAPFFRNGTAELTRNEYLVRFSGVGLMWLRSDTMFWTGIGMNAAITSTMVLRTHTEPEAL